MTDGAVFTADAIIDPSTVAPLPVGYYQIVSSGGQQLLTAYELGIEPPSDGRVEIAFEVPWLLSFKELKFLRVLHGEVDLATGELVLVDRTLRHAFDHNDPSQSLVFARFTSLSPFLTARVKAQTVDTILGPTVPLAMGGTATMTATFTDPDPRDLHTAIWEWADGSTSAGTVTEPDIVSGEEIPGSVAGTHVYSAPGVYTVRLYVNDNTAEGGIGSATYDYVVVYDPSGGFVTGGGWINSPPGAYPDDPTLTGKANFGFVAKYVQGSQVPSGTTEFRFNAAGLNFQSSSYQWLVVAGAKAKYKGVGTVNGVDGYGFMISAIDGALPGGGGQDTFRMKIWEVATEELIYDNQLDVPEDADPTTILGGGSIVIHRT